MGGKCSGLRVSWKGIKSFGFRQDGTIVFQGECVASGSGWQEGERSRGGVEVE